MILGCVLAGGQSTRFGSDKALAELDGHSLLIHAVDALSPWCEKVVVVGREEAPAPTLPDWPRAHMGPLGGIAAALHMASDEDYLEVLTCGVDSADLPEDPLAPPVEDGMVGAARRDPLEPVGAHLGRRHGRRGRCSAKALLGDCR